MPVREIGVCGRRQAPALGGTADRLRLLARGDDPFLGHGVEMLAHRHGADPERAGQAVGTLRPLALQDRAQAVARAGGGTVGLGAVAHGCLIKIFLEKEKWVGS
jgi:hypothetical protein